MADTPSGMSREDIKKLAQEIANLNKGAPGSSTTSASTGLFNKELDSITAKLNPFSAGVTVAGKAVDIATSAYQKIEEVVKPNLATFRELSKTGASFSNDVVGMIAAQKGMRLSQDEFVDVMKQNAANLTGLGGNVTRGAEAFAKFSDEFMSSQFTDGLKQAGFTNKELNDVLGLQLTMQRYTFREDEASRKASIESAAKLATEMDLQAKLTGKSREEQMANMRQVKEDAAIEAKFRMIGLQQGADAEKAARENYAGQFNKALLTGTEKAFRESVIYGSAVSKEANMQLMGAGQEAGKSVVEAGRLFKQGEFERSKEAQNRAQAEIVNYQKTAGFLQSVMIPSGNAFVESSKQGLKTNQGVYDALQKVGQMEEHKYKTTAEQLKVAEKMAAEAAAGKDKEGKEVSGATKAMINLGTRVDEVEAALYKKMVIPINEMVGPALGRLANNALGRDTVKPSGASSTFKEDFEGLITRGRTPPTPSTSDSKIGFGDRLKEEPTNIPGGGFVVDSARTIFKGAEIFTSAVDAFNAKTVKPKASLYSGTPGLFNQVVHDFGTETEALLHGKKAVLNQDQLLSMAKGIQTDTFSRSFDTLKNTSTSSSLDVKSMMAPLQNMDFEKQFKEKFVPGPDTKNSAAQKANETGMSQVFNETLIEKQRFMESGKDKKATLDDVVGSLNNLNTKIERLLDAQLDLGTRQIKATKSNNSNIYSRA